jgi:hypothetical protein
MFTAKQKKLMMILGIVSDYEQSITYDAYCEVACEMSAEGMNAGTFADYLQRKIDIALFIAQRNSEKTLAQMAV